MTDAHALEPVMRKALLTITEFQAVSGLGRSKTYELIANGELESVKVGRRRFIPVEAVDEWVARPRVQAANSV